MSLARNGFLVLAGCLVMCVDVAPAVTAAPGAADRPQARASASSLPDCRAAVRFDRHHFPLHPRGHNRWLSLRPGLFFVLRGKAEGDDGKLHPHTITSAVTHVTKVIDGVTTRVVFERDYQDGTLQESELAFEAADRRGNVWNMGEYPEEYDQGRLTGAPSTWIAGLAHARAGIGMLARPRLGTPPYLQGSSPRVGFRDCGQVAARGRTVCIPMRCFRRVLVIAEWAPADPAGGRQLKYYAPRIGAIKVGQRDGGNSAEELHLVRHVVLHGARLRAIDRAVLRQDRRGYRVSPHLYGRTRRAHLDGR